MHRPPCSPKKWKQCSSNSKSLRNWLCTLPALKKNFFSILNMGIRLKYLMKILLLVQLIRFFSLLYNAGVSALEGSNCQQWIFCNLQGAMNENNHILHTRNRTTVYGLCVIDWFSILFYFVLFVCLFVCFLKGQIW